MIYVKLHGRIGNHLFEMGAAATIAAHNNDQFCAVCHKDYKIAPPDNCYVWDFIQPYRDNIYKKIPIIESAPDNLIPFCQKGFKYKEIPYQKNLLLDGGFQSYKYLDERIIKDLFSIPEELKNKILSQYKEIFTTAALGIPTSSTDDNFWN